MTIKQIVLWLAMVMPGIRLVGGEPLTNVVGRIMVVSNVTELVSAVTEANEAGGERTILIADG